MTSGAPDPVQGQRAEGVGAGGAPLQEAAPVKTSWLGRFCSRLCGKPRQAAAVQTASQVSTSRLPKLKSFFSSISLSTISFSAKKISLFNKQPADLINDLRKHPKLRQEFEKECKIVKGGENAAFIIDILKQLPKKGTIEEGIAQLPLQTFQDIYTKYIYNPDAEQAKSGYVPLDFEGPVIKDTKTYVNISDALYQRITAAYKESSQPENADTAKSRLAEGIAAAFNEIASMTAQNLRR